MKLGTARRGGTGEVREPRSRFPVPPGYHLIERLELSHDGMRAGRREDWRAEAPGGFAVQITVFRTDATATPAQVLDPGLAGDLMRVRHPNLLPVFGCWPIDGGLVLVTELTERSLRDRLLEACEGGEVGVGREELVEYLAEAAKALDVLGDDRRFGGHGRVLPQTLRLVGGGIKLGLPHLPSWQIGAVADPASLPYTAPEIVRGATITARADQFSLAAIYCHLRGGRHPFPDLALAGCEGPPLTTIAFSRRVDLSMIPGSERPAVARALADDPGRRWDTCRTFVAALQADVRASESGAVPAFGPPDPTDTAPASPVGSDDRVSPARGTALALATATGLTAVAATLALTRLSRESDAPAPAPGATPAAFLARAPSAPVVVRLPNAEGKPARPVSESPPTLVPAFAPRCRRPTRRVGGLRVATTSTCRAASGEAGPPLGVARDVNKAVPRTNPRVTPNSSEVVETDRLGGDDLLSRGRADAAVAAYSEADVSPAGPDAGGSLNAPRRRSNA